MKVPTRGSKLLPDAISRDEVKRNLEATIGPRQRAMLMTAYAAGVRVNELVNLKLEDICPDRHLIHVRCGKGGRERYTLLSEALLQQLQITGGSNGRGALSV